MANISKIQIESGTYDIKDNVARERINNIDYEQSHKNYAHRGLSSEAPENTLAAFYKAGYHECYGIEFDVQATSDGKLIVMHDLTVDRMTDGTGTVNNLTSSYINSLTIDAGNCVSEYPTQNVPWLYQVLKLCNDFNLHPMIELKGTWTSANYDDLIYLLYNYNIVSRTTVISFDITQLTALRAKDANIKMAYLYGDEITSTIINAVIDIGKCGLSLDYTNNGTISTYNRLLMLNNKVPFGFWTVNDKTSLNNVLTNNPGTSFITSNYGYGGEIKQYTKQMIAQIAQGAGTFYAWQLSYSDKSIAYYYDSFTVEWDNDAQEYVISYVTPFSAIINNYSTVVNAHIESYSFENAITPYVHGQTQNGFRIALIDSEGNRLSTATLPTGYTGYINFSIIGY